MGGGGGGCALTPPPPPPGSTPDADDTVIVSADVCGQTAIEKVVSAFTQFREWCKLNNIQVNRGKTRHMLGRNSRTICDAENVKCLNGIINVDSFVYLGVNVNI